LGVISIYFSSRSGQIDIKSQKHLRLWLFHAKIGDGFLLHVCKAVNFISAMHIVCYRWESFNY